MKRVLLALAMSLLVSPAFAVEAWDFGTIPYGAKITSQPAGVTGWSCDEDGGCTFSDSQGVDYVTWDDEVVIKRHPVQTGDAHLPFGLSANDGIPSAVAKVANHAHVTLECTGHADNPSIEPGETFCSAKVLGDDPGVWLTLHFGAGDRLEMVEIFTHYI